MVAQAQVRRSSHQVLVVTAWVVMLLVSVLPNAIWYEATGGADARWLLWSKMALLLALAAATLAWHALRPLRNFVLILLAIYAAEELVSVLTGTATWQAWLGGAQAPFTQSMLGIQLGRLVVSGLMIGTLPVLGYRRRDFYLTLGKLDAPIEPVRWLGFMRSMPWTRFGAMWAVFISLGLSIFLVIGGRPNWPSFVQAAPMLPMVVLLAAMNAFNEEMTYRAPMLASLENVVGPRHALWNAALFFGLGHYFGVPYGVVGVVMASFMGWLLGKAMLETRGFFWAWLIHFLQDVLIFSFMAAGSIRPGG